MNKSASMESILALSPGVLASSQTRRRLCDGDNGRRWGEEQADSYIRGLMDFLTEAPAKRYMWRQVRRHESEGIYRVKYRHFIFFRKIADLRWVS